MKEYICRYCGRICKNDNSLRNHERLCKQNPNRQVLKSNFIEYNKKIKCGEIVKKYTNQYDKARKLGLPIPQLTEETKQKISEKSKQFKHSEETKRHISKIRKEYLFEHPDQAPYLLNHHRKGCSYPESYFKTVFNDDIFIGVESEYPILLYHLDFAWPDKKKYVEIDGEQHYCDKRIVEHDKKRTEALLELGWKGYRIRWSEYKRMNDEDKRQEIENIYHFITL